MIKRERIISKRKLAEELNKLILAIFIFLDGRS